MKLQRNINRLGKIIVLNSIINAHGFDTSIYILYCAQGQGRQTGGVGGVSTPPEFCMGG